MKKLLFIFIVMFSLSSYGQLYMGKNISKLIKEKKNSTYVKLLNINESNDSTWIFTIEGGVEKYWCSVNDIIIIEIIKTDDESLATFLMQYHDLKSSYCFDTVWLYNCNNRKIEVTYYEDYNKHVFKSIFKN